MIERSHDAYARRVFTVNHTQNESILNGGSRDEALAIQTTLALIRGRGGVQLERRAVRNLTAGRRAFEMWHAQKAEVCEQVSHATITTMQSDPRHQLEAGWLSFYKKLNTALTVEGVKPTGMDILFNTSHGTRARLLEEFVRTALKQRTGQPVSSRRRTARPICKENKRKSA